MKDTLRVMVLGKLPSVPENGSPSDIKREYIELGLKIRKLISPDFIKEHFGENQVILDPEIENIYLINMPNISHSIIESMTADILVAIPGWESCKDSIMCLFNVQHGIVGRLIMQLSKNKIDDNYFLEKFPYLFSLGVSNPPNKDPMRLVKGTINIKELTEGDNIVDLGGAKIHVRKEKKKKMERNNKLNAEVQLIVKNEEYFLLLSGLEDESTEKVVCIPINLENMIRVSDKLNLTIHEEVL